jgi:hypothetical protein
MNVRYFDRIHLATIKPSFATWKASTIDNTRDGTVPDPRGGYLVTTRLHAAVGELQPAAKPFVGPRVVKPAASGRGTVPDYVVPRTTADILRGVD